MLAPGGVGESPEAFFERFRDLAVEAYLYPVPWSFPLLLAKTEAGFLYAMDRGAPPAPTGKVRALFHGLVQEALPYNKGGWCGRGYNAPHFSAGIHGRLGIPPKDALCSAKRTSWFGLDRPEVTLLGQPRRGYVPAPLFRGGRRSPLAEGA